MILRASSAPTLNFSNDVVIECFRIMNAYKINVVEVAFNSGNVHVFSKGGDGQWEYSSTILKASNPQLQDQFGSSLALNSDTIAVGAPEHDFGKGAVYIFENQNNMWTETQILRGSQSEYYDSFGYSLSMSDEFLIVGSPKSDEFGTFSGSVYLYKKENVVNSFGELELKWVEKEILIPADIESGMNFGMAVGISQHQLIIGSRQYDIVDQQNGAAYIYNINVTVVFTEIEWD